jgi:hypothetical protein
MATIKKTHCEARVLERGSNSFTCEICFLNPEKNDIEIIKTLEPRVSGIQKQENKDTEYEKLCKELANIFYVKLWSNKEYSEKKTGEFFEDLEKTFKNSNTKKDNLLKMISPLWRRWHKKKIEQYFKSLNHQSVNVSEAEKILNDEKKRISGKGELEAKIKKLEQLEKIIKEDETENIKEKIGFLREFYRKYNFSAKRSFFSSKTYQLDFKIFYRNLDKEQKVGKEQKVDNEKKAGNERPSVINASTSVKIAPNNFAMLLFTSLGSILGAVLYLCFANYDGKNTEGKFWFEAININLSEWKNLVFLAVVSIILSSIVYLMFSVLKKDNYEIFRYNVIYTFLLGVFVGMLQAKVFSYLLRGIETLTGIGT